MLSVSCRADYLAPFANGSKSFPSQKRETCSCFFGIWSNNKNFEVFQHFWSLQILAKTCGWVSCEFTVDRLHWCVTPRHPTPKRTRPKPVRLIGCTHLSMSASAGLMHRQWLNRCVGRRWVDHRFNRFGTRSKGINRSRKFNRSAVQRYQFFLQSSNKTPIACCLLPIVTVKKLGRP